MQNWKTTLAGVATILVAAGNALSQISSGHVDMLALSAGLMSGLGLIVANDPKKADPVVGSTLKALAVLCLTSLMACATINGHHAAVTVDGQTVTITVNADGTACTTYTPPITYGTETCSQICDAKTFPFINATCTSSTGVLHTVQLVRVSP